MAIPTTGYVLTITNFKRGKKNPGLQLVGGESMWWEVFVEYSQCRRPGACLGCRRMNRILRENCGAVWQDTALTTEIGQVGQGGTSKQLSLHGKIRLCMYPQNLMRVKLVKSNQAQKFKSTVNAH